jgi:adenosylcobalamin-dependent ribonucleoside-triphosphate reductase
MSPSFRAQLVTQRTYCRPKTDNDYETWSEVIDRVISHQEWLWKRALGRSLNKSQQAELEELRQTMLERKGLVAGRTLWLGGTDISRRRESSMFNCSHLRVQTVHDFVDMLWLLLQGCGVGFTPVAGTLFGFVKPIHNVKIIRSDRTLKGGRETNLETWDAETKTWTISVGDSAEAWAKSIGKLLAFKKPAETLVLDFSEIRGPGQRLKGYGWISQGDATIAKAYEAIAKIMNRRAGQMLRKMDIHDIGNWLGTILSTRRSAQISLMDYGSPEWREFATCKKNMYETGNSHREQSNNSLVFYTRPTKEQLSEIFKLMMEAGGSEPGFVNGQEALKRAPWFMGMNPCGEILLPDKGFCNLVSIDLAKFADDNAGLHRTTYLMARANYRQTCVHLDDGILQRAWHENNENLRLCGVSFMGQAMRPDLTDYDRKQLRNTAVQGAYSMANELGTPLPKNVTTGKPDGTVAKISDTTEGIHKPLGRYIFNNVAFSGHDPLVPMLRANGYRVFDHPSRPGDVLATLPMAWDNVEFDTVNGLEVNLESAVSQLNRYKSMMQSFIEQNQSITISYDPEEVPGIVDWIHENWDDYVGVSFLYRNDPTKTAADLGYLYLPQEVVTRATYDQYMSQLKPFDVNGGELIEMDDCAGGACPIR